MMMGHKRDETPVDCGTTVDESRKRENAIAMAAYARKTLRKWKRFWWLSWAAVWLTELRMLL